MKIRSVLIVASTLQAQLTDAGAMANGVATTANNLESLYNNENNKWENTFSW